MINMVKGYKDKESYFITDIVKEEDKLVITYADGRKEDCKFNDRNLGFYRHKMIEQSKTNLPEFTKRLGNETFKAYVAKYGEIIAGIIGLFFLYNVDIHIIMKIILTISIVLGEMLLFFFNEIMLTVISEDVREVLATEYYINNIHDFQYYESEKGVDGYIVPPEDIGNHKLDDRQLAQMSETIKDFKSQGVYDNEISLTYQKINPKVGPERK